MALEVEDPRDQARLLLDRAQAPAAHPSQTVAVSSSDTPDEASRLLPGGPPYAMKTLRYEEFRSRTPMPATRVDRVFDVVIGSVLEHVRGCQFSNDAKGPPTLRREGLLYDSRAE